MTGQILAAFVASQSDLAELVGTRVRPITADVPDVRPYLTYQEIDGFAIDALDGPAGINDTRLQVNIVSASYGQAKLIRRLLCGTKDDVRFNGFRGTLAGCDVRRVRLVDWRDEYETPQSGEARGPYEIQLDFMIAFDEGAVLAEDWEG